MEEEKITFSVQMTTREIYRFTMHHVYHSFSGILGICLSLMALFSLIVSFDSMTDQTKTVLTIIAAWFVVIDPVVLYFRAKGQVKRNKAYQKPLNYRLDQEGITVSQDEEQQTIAWENLMKIVETGSQYLVYSSRIHAFIFPKKSIGENGNLFNQMIRYYAKVSGIPLRGQIRKASEEEV